MIKDDIARLLRKSNAMSDAKRNLQLLESKIISEGWNNVPINGIYGSSDRTMLHLAVQADVNGSFIDVIKFLIENGININARDSRGDTVLHYISSGNTGCTDSQYDIAKLILDHGGDLSVFNINNMTALRPTLNHWRDDYKLMRLFFKYKISDEALNDLKEAANIIGNSQVAELIAQKIFE
jgi:ankyrin repeat protein